MRMNKKLVLSLVVSMLLLGLAILLGQLYVGRFYLDDSPDDAPRAGTLHEFDCSAGHLAQDSVDSDPMGADGSPPKTNGAVQIANRNITEDYPEHLTEFLKTPKGSIFLESYVRERLLESDLPYLYRALRNNSFAGQWGDIVFAICVLEEGEKALRVVQEFVSTPWDWQGSPYSGQSAESAIRIILTSVRYLAMVEPALSGHFLQDAFTQEGAEKLLQQWRRVPLPAGMPFDTALVNVVRYNAATGLLHIRSPELFKVVEEKFYELASLPYAERTDSSYALEICKLHLGERDLYNEMGWEEGVTYLYGLDGEEKFQKGFEFYLKYTELEVELSGGQEN